MPVPHQAPDIQHGHIALATEGRNTWVTEVQCAVRERGAQKRGGQERGSQERWLYLSQECRCEFLPLSSGDLGGTRRVFQPDKPWEFMVAIDGGTAYQITTPDIGYLPQRDADPAEPLDEVDVAAQPFVPPFAFDVRCPGRAIRPLPFDELLARLRDGDLDVRNTFLHVAWQDGERHLDFYCPCRYINFPPTEGGPDRYVQPISGYVLFPRPGAPPAVAYVACAIGPDRTLAEFCLRRYRNALEWVARDETVTPAAREHFHRLSLGVPLAVPAFDAFRRADGATCTLYAYA